MVIFIKPQGIIKARWNTGCARLGLKGTGWTMEEKSRNIPLNRAIRFFILLFKKIGYTLRHMDKKRYCLHILYDKAI